MQKAAELEDMAQTATDSGKESFHRLAEGYRRLAAQSSSLTQATDDEIEKLASRMAGRSPPDK